MGVPLVVPSDPGRSQKGHHLDIADGDPHDCRVKVGGLGRQVRHGVLPFASWIESAVRAGIITIPREPRKQPAADGYGRRGCRASGPRVARRASRLSWAAWSAAIAGRTERPET